MRGHHGGRCGGAGDVDVGGDHAELVLGDPGRRPHRPAAPDTDTVGAGTRIGDLVREIRSHPGPGQAVDQGGGEFLEQHDVGVRPHNRGQDGRVRGALRDVRGEHPHRDAVRCGGFRADEPGQLHRSGGDGERGGEDGGAAPAQEDQDDRGDAGRGRQEPRQHRQRQHGVVGHRDEPDGQSGGGDHDSRPGERVPGLAQESWCQARTASGRSRRAGRGSPRIRLPENFPRRALPLIPTPAGPDPRRN